MVIEELVKEVNENFRVLRTRAIVTGQNEIIVSVIENLIRLTDVENFEQDKPSATDADLVSGFDEAQKKAATFSASTSQVVAINTVCPHKELNVFGRCTKCNACLHTNQTKYGYCLTCDTQLPASVG